MPETLIEISRNVGQYNTKAPITLIRRWVKNRFEQILDRRKWSWQWGHGSWLVKPAIFSNVAIVQGSNEVVFPASVLPSSSSQIAGWQFLLSHQVPYYTVTSILNPTTITVDRAIEEPTNGETQSTTLMCYFMSEQPDFEAMIAIVDRSNNWQLRWNVTMEEMDNDDPQRSTVSPPTRGVSLGFNDQYLAALPDGVTDYYGQTNQSRPQPIFETWPRGPIVQPYPYYYKRRTPTIQDSTPLPGFLRGRVLYEGALADLCGWPGTATMPNPTFNPVYANMHERKFEDYVVDMINRDEQATQRTLRWAGSYQNLGFAEFESARYAQNHVPSGLVAGSPYGRF